MTKSNKDERVFIDLLNACHEHDSYSLVEICPKLGFSYQKIIELAAKNEEFDYILELCRTCCACNAECAGLMKRIPASTMIKYLRENHYRLRVCPH